MDRYEDIKYWKKALTDEDLADLLEITEDQAENSDIGGDSDAEDAVEKYETSTTRSSVGLSSFGSPGSPWSEAPSSPATPSSLAAPSSPATPSCSAAPSPPATPSLPVVISSATVLSPPLTKRIRLLRQTLKPQPSISMASDSQPSPSINSTSIEEDYSPFDSDDSVADATYEPDRPHPLQRPPESESDSDSDVEDAEPETISEFEIWTKIPLAPEKFQNFQFRENMGPNVQVNSEKPVDFVTVFLTSTCLQNIVVQSNIYATQAGTCLDLTIEELNAFLGVLIIMGFNDLPSLKSYWSRNPNFFNSRISKIFSVKRFLKILRYLHVSDNSQMPARGEVNYDKLYKIRPLLTHLKEVFGNSFTPSRNVAIDKSVVAFKGRTSLKQYMPMKPIKRGIKIWAMGCAETGYIMSFDVYQGKGGESEHTLGERVVLELSEALQNKGYCLYFDNFFTTIPLMKKLSERGLFGCGTRRQNRKFFPKDQLINDKKMKMGQYDVAVCKEISVAKWKDRGKKAVTMRSNIHNAGETGRVLRRNNKGDREEVVCPSSIVDYNKYMGGVDRFDQRMASYNIAWKTRRWWMKIFYFLIDASIVNGYILYKQTLKMKDPRKKPISHLEFRSKLADQLIGNYSGRKRPGPPLATPGSFQNVGHLVRRTTSRRCAQCSKRGKQTRTSMECSDCQVALCLDCFVPFHTVM